MKPRRFGRKPDLFGLLLVVVTLGVSISVAYQVSVHQPSVAFIVDLAQTQGG